MDYMQGLGLNIDTVMTDELKSRLEPTLKDNYTNSFKLYCKDSMNDISSADDYSPAQLMRHNLKYSLDFFRNSIDTPESHINDKEDGIQNLQVVNICYLEKSNFNSVKESNFLHVRENFSNLLEESCNNKINSSTCNQKISGIDNESCANVENTSDKLESSEDEEKNLERLLEPDVIIYESKSDNSTNKECSKTVVNENQGKTLEKANADIPQDLTIKNSEEITPKKPKIREKTHECNICQKAFMTKLQLTDHIRTHTGERPYTCKLCNKCFTHSSTLSKHSRTHTGERPFVCSICHRAFAQSGHLTSHVRETHSGERAHKCKYCDKAFARSNALTVHMRLHTGETPFKCDSCEKVFKSNGALVTHALTHNNEDEMDTDGPLLMFEDKIQLLLENEVTHNSEERINSNGALTAHNVTFTPEGKMKLTSGPLFTHDIINTDSDKLKSLITHEIALAAEDTFRANYIQHVVTQTTQKELSLV
ncbi:zinc finger protein 286A-like [Ctenocephalides felis]|uniref:zinc finger protein 286A-like n=1 Tax=Ctenocephalides felis TaxID=7515 RepID=UPI000E6E22B2|nr:zinc finger protein 286A-like [Ctenocephalides felis]